MVFYKTMTKGIIYYTDNKLKEPLFSLVQKYISASELPIVSCSLKPINFGKNIVLENRERSYPTIGDPLSLSDGRWKFSDGGV